MAKKAPESRVITSSAERTAAPATEAHSTRHHALSSITQNYKQVLGMVAGLSLAGVSVAACGDAFEAGNSTTSQTSPNTASNTGGAGGNTPTNTAGGTTGKGGETHTGNGGNGGEGGSGTGGKGGFGGFGGQGGIGGLGGVGGLGGSGGTEIDAGDLDAAVDASMDAKADAALEDAGIDAAGGNGGAGGQGVGGMGGQGGFGGAGGAFLDAGDLDAASDAHADAYLDAGEDAVDASEPCLGETLIVGTNDGFANVQVTQFNNNCEIKPNGTNTVNDNNLQFVNKPVTVCYEKGDKLLIQVRDPGNTDTLDISLPGGEDKFFDAFKYGDRFNHKGALPVDSTELKNKCMAAVGQADAFVALVSDDKSASKNSVTYTGNNDPSGSSIMRIK